MMRNENEAKVIDNTGPQNVCNFNQSRYFF